MEELEQKRMDIKRFCKRLLCHPISLIREWWYKKQNHVLSEYTDKYIEYFNHLFARAANTGGLEYLYTILRVEGITSGHWDAFVESEEAVADFSKMLRKMGSGQEKRALRTALFIYCHLTEMSAPYEIICNLLRCCMNQSYKFYPFAHLVRVIKNNNGFDKRLLPYPSKKIAFIKELTAMSGEERLSQIIEDFFSNDVRNAFYHSDYTISEDEFRIIDGAGPGGESISLEKLSDMLARCFAFYSAFFIVYKKVRKGLAAGDHFLLQNCQLRGKKLDFALRKPFDSIEKYANCSTLLRDQDSNLEPSPYTYPKIT